MWCGCIVLYYVAIHHVKLTVSLLFSFSSSSPPPLSPSLPPLPHFEYTGFVQWPAVRGRLRQGTCWAAAKLRVLPAPHAGVHVASVWSILLHAECHDSCPRPSPKQHMRQQVRGADHGGQGTLNWLYHLVEGIHPIAWCKRIHVLEYYFPTHPHSLTPPPSTPPTHTVTNHRQKGFYVQVAQGAWDFHRR